MNEHFHVMIYAKNVRMYDLKCDRNEAIDLASKYIADIYSEIGREVETHRKMAIRLSQLDSEEIHHLMADPANPLNCIIMHCEGGCEPQYMLS